MIKDSETFIYIMPFQNEFGITFIWNVFLHCDLHKFSELNGTLSFEDISHCTFITFGIRKSSTSNSPCD